MESPAGRYSFEEITEVVNSLLEDVAADSNALTVLLKGAPTFWSVLYSFIHLDKLPHVQPVMKKNNNGEVIFPSGQSSLEIVDFSISLVCS